MPDDVPRRRPGRPRLPAHDTGSSVSCWIPSHDHDHLIKLANKREMSVSALVRDLITRRLPPHE